MKINIDNYNVRELNKKELINTNGGDKVTRAIFWFFGQVARVVEDIATYERSKPPGMTWNEYNGKF
ncbi:MAG: hypothetical protein HRT66_09790 [Flavobacteriaceae bacterium]|nr:hypothetical protein [Flavobacteriaceae bacterium]